MLIFIIGYMGSGKTVFGQQLAGRLGYRFLDMDEMIEISTGYSIAHYFEKFGEHSFRLKERSLLINHLTEKDCVIATGGGTPCFEDNLALMNANGITVFLDTPEEIILKRISVKIAQRPLLSHIPQDQLPEFIHEHMSVRRFYYEQAKLTVKGGDLEVERLVERLLTLPGNSSSDADKSRYL